MYFFGFMRAWPTVCVKCETDAYSQLNRANVTMRFFLLCFCLSFQLFVFLVDLICIKNFKCS